MRTFAVLAILCFLQTIASHGIKDQKHDNHVQKPSNQGQGVLASEQNVVQHVAEQAKPNVEVQKTNNNPAKVSVEIPPKVQQIVTQVSQHIPQVVAHHVANKNRVVRSVQNRVSWKEMQVSPVEQPGKCEYLCHEQETTVCGHNGRCYWQFKGQCDLNIYNCLNTQQIFQVVDFAKCQDAGAAKCYRGDM